MFLVVLPWLKVSLCNFVGHQVESKQRDLKKPPRSSKRGSAKKSKKKSGSGTKKGSTKVLPRAARSVLESSTSCKTSPPTSSNEVDDLPPARPSGVNVARSEKNDEYFMAISPPTSTLSNESHFDNGIKSALNPQHPLRAQQEEILIPYSGPSSDKGRVCIAGIDAITRIVTNLCAQTPNRDTTQLTRIEKRE